MLLLLSAISIFICDAKTVVHRKTRTRYVMSNPDPIFNSEVAQNHIFVESADGDEIQNAMQIQEDYNIYYDNYYFENEEEDFLQFFDVFDIDLETWRDENEWDAIYEVQLENDQKVTQKCAQFDNLGDSWCLCQFQGHKTKYECKEKQNILSDYANRRRLPSKRDTIAHHLFNKAFARWITYLDQSFQAKGVADYRRYVASWDFPLPEHLISYYHPDAKALEIKIFESLKKKYKSPKYTGPPKAELEILREAQTRAHDKFAKPISFTEMVGRFKFSVSKHLHRDSPDFLPYLEFDENKDDAAKINDVKSAFFAYIGNTGTKGDLETIVDTFIDSLCAPGDALEMRRLRRWYPGGIHPDPTGATYHFKVSYPKYWFDGPLGKYLYEVKLGNPYNPDTGDYAPEYQEWELMKAFGRFIHGKFKDLAGDIEKVKAGKY